MVHAAGMIAMLADQVGQAPVQIQCVQQSAQEPWVKWLLPTIVQTVVSLFSIGAGVGIAVWSFRRNRQTEHEQWVRDQKKAEWSALLRGVANVFHITNFTTINGWNGKIANRIVSELEGALEEVSIARANCIFRQNKGVDKHIEEFIREATHKIRLLQGNLGLSESLAGRILQKDSENCSDNEHDSFQRTLDIITRDIFKLATQSRNLLDELQHEAALELGATAKGEEHKTARTEI